MAKKADLSAVELMRSDWLAALGAEPEVEMDCTDVELFSAAAAQLVVSLVAMMKITGGVVRLTHISDSLRGDLLLLGMPEYIQELPAHV